RGRPGGEGRFAPRRPRQGVPGRGPGRGKPEGGGGGRPPGESPRGGNGVARVRRTGVPRTRATTLPARGGARGSSVPATICVALQAPGQSGFHWKQSVCQSTRPAAIPLQVVKPQPLGGFVLETDWGPMIRGGCNCYKTRRSDGKKRPKDARRHLL